MLYCLGLTVLWRLKLLSYGKGTVEHCLRGEDALSNVILTSLIEAGHQRSLVVTPYYENFVYKRLELTCNKIIPLLRAKKKYSE